MAENPLVLFDSEAKIGHVLDAYVRASLCLYRPRLPDNEDDAQAVAAHIQPSNVTHSRFFRF
jgi:predicted membrane-bound mannosyltransferase